MVTILFLALGLSMDSFAVAMTGGITEKKPKLINGLKIALFFGFFQGFMPLLGWMIGSAFKNVISNIDHWIAFGLLGCLGVKMIYESGKKGMNKRTLNLTNNRILLLLSVATSIDALIAGISFAFIQISLILSTVIIGCLTFILSFTGFCLGNNIGKILKNKVSIFGGVALIGIGLKILITHLI